jgi:hypothetical protein
MTSGKAYWKRLHCCRLSDGKSLLPGKKHPFSVLLREIKEAAFADSLTGTFTALKPSCR